ncbi:MULTISPECIES: plastocyanin/azurin family copper-binding protein [unclassified Marinobacter]|uniref:plastocyanin/azurin family copper-binding protein n=1 Tax=unclassified Marinobacter TaxID=83889 RepID=UPI000BFA49CB|nr:MULTISPECIES: plastocyanin/azurin family copper-binding protein [unclassified Marinobacter]
MKHSKALLTFILLFSSSLLWASEPAATVNMGNQLRFEPASITIKSGETVEFVNGSLLVHTVTADPAKARSADNVSLPAGAKPFDSGNLASGESFSHTFI